MDLMKRLIKLFISVIYYIFDQLLFIIKTALAKGNTNRIIILYYHAVKNIEIDNFKKQMDLVIKKTEPVSLSCNKVKKKNKFFKHYSSITFDDGFSSIIANVMPEIELRTIPITIFIPSKCLGQKPIWLNDYNDRDYDEVIVNRNELLELSKNSLVTIGTHGQYHKNLLSINLETSKKEIIDSKVDLGNYIEKQIQFISFPHGAYNDVHLEIAKEAGYKNIFTIEPKTENIEFLSYEVGRVEVNPSNWNIEFYLKLMGAYNWFSHFKKLKFFLLDNCKPNLYNLK